jgi:uncharacterized membrane protein required for colicin V production
MKLPFNWFDFVLVALIILGLRSGRKRGLSEELMIFLMWLAILVGCALLYQPVGNILAGTSAAFSPLSSYIMAYIFIGIVISAIFLYLKKTLGGKLVGSDVFGGAEFYLGMFAGMVRFVCVLLCALALLHARAYTQQEVQAEIKYQNDVYGSNFFPTIQSLQAQVFQDSLTGPLINDYLGILMIKPTPPGSGEIKRKEWSPP